MESCDQLQVIRPNVNSAELALRHLLAARTPVIDIFIRNNNAWVPPRTIVGVHVLANHGPTVTPTSQEVL
jgi:hypothetical protein